MEWAAITKTAVVNAPSPGAKFALKDTLGNRITQNQLGGCNGPHAD